MGILIIGGDSMKTTNKVSKSTKACSKKSGACSGSDEKNYSTTDCGVKKTKDCGKNCK